MQYPCQENVTSNAAIVNNHGTFRYLKKDQESGKALAVFVLQCSMVARLPPVYRSLQYEMLEIVAYYMDA